MLKPIAMITPFLLSINSASAALVYGDDFAQVPEPSSLILLFIGFLCVIKVRRSINTKPVK